MASQSLNCNFTWIRNLAVYDLTAPHLFSASGTMEQPNQLSHDELQLCQADEPMVPTVVSFAHAKTLD